MTEQNEPPKTVPEPVRTKLEPVRSWLNHVVKTRRKHILSSALLVVFIILGSLYQFGQLRSSDMIQQNEATYQVALNQYTTCLTRVQTRETVRSLFMGIYDDMLMVFPQVVEIEELRQRGYDRINREYPSLPRDECDGEKEALGDRVPPLLFFPTDVIPAIPPDQVTPQP